MKHTLRPTTRLATWLAAAIAASTLALSACSPNNDRLHANAFPMAQVSRFDQPVPTKHLFDSPVLTHHDLLRPAKPDIHEPLPPQAALPQAKNIEAAPSNTGSRDDGGAVNPAAGQAAAITDGQGEGGKHELGASK